MYYLNARYYNAEWGRFINADGYGGNVGNLLSHNVFSYCMNNPVNMSDPSGNWPSFSGIVKAAKSVVKNIIKTVVTVVVKVVTAVVNTVKSAVSSVMNNPYLKGTMSGGIDKYVEKKAEKYIPKTTRGFVYTGKLTLQKYITTPGAAARVSKGASKHVGAATIAFTAKDILTSVSNKQYKGAALDLVGGIAGVAAGIVIGALVTSVAATIGLPVILGSAIAFGATVAVGAYIDNRISRKREEIYGS